MFLLQLSIQKHCQNKVFLSSYICVCFVLCPGNFKSRDNAHTNLILSGGVCMCVCVVHEPVGLALRRGYPPLPTQ